MDILILAGIIIGAYLLMLLTTTVITKLLEGK